MYLDNITIGDSNQQEHNINLAKFLAVAKSHNLTFNESKCVNNTDTVDLLGSHHGWHASTRSRKSENFARITITEESQKTATCNRLIRLLCPVDSTILRQN